MLRSNRTLRGVLLVISCSLPLLLLASFDTNDLGGHENQTHHELFQACLPPRLRQSARLASFSGCTSADAHGSFPYSDLFSRNSFGTRALASPFCRYAFYRGMLFILPLLAGMGNQDRGVYSNMNSHEIVIEAWKNLRYSVE